MAYVKSLAPHIYNADSVSKRYWQGFAFLLPCVVFSWVLFGGHAFLVALLVLILAGFIQKGFCQLVKQSEPLSNGHTFYLAMIFILLLPPHIPFMWVLLGVVGMILIGKYLWGGLNAYPFHPALLGYLAMSFFYRPSSMESGISKDSSLLVEKLLLLKSQMTHFFPEEVVSFIAQKGFVLAESSALLILIGGFFLIIRGIIRWEAPVLFLGTFYFLALVFFESREIIFSGFFLLFAFYIVTDSVCTPISRLAHGIFCVAASAIAFLFWAKNSLYPLEALTLGVLSMNALTPWFDEWFQPQGSRLAMVSGKETKGALS